MWNKKMLNLHYSICHILFWLSACTVNGYVSYYVVEKGYNVSYVGVVFALANILSLIIQPYVASLADRSLKIRVKHIIFILELLASSFAMFLFVYNIPNILFLSIYILIILTISMQIPLLNSLSSEHILSGTNVNYSIARGCGSVSFAVMSIIFGKLTSKFGADITMPYYACFSLLYGICTLMFPAPQKHLLLSDSSDSLSIMEFIKKYKRFVITCFALFLIYMSVAFISNYIFQIVSSVGGDSASLGLALGLAAFVELFSMLLYPKFKKYLKSHANVLKFSSLFYIVKAGLTFISINMIGFYVAQGFQFLSFGLYIPAQVYYVTKIISKENLVKGQMFMNFSSTLAVVLSSILGSLLINIVGIKLSLLVTIVISCIGFSILMYNVEQDK